MTEPQYASLAFDDWCHFCLAPEVEEIAWVCRVRCCHKCIKKQFISEDELDLYIPENVCIEKPDSIFPFILLPQKRVAGRNKPLYFLPRAREYLEELEEVESLMDDKALARWSYEKKEIQTARVEVWSFFLYFHAFSH
ncbi:hypothetical protein BDZ97DRAFT_266555 [Flammula alnicola]|nr:hypothetical protein BDZ97DRAFT_266555 [Flammula alnicola]